MGRGLKDFDNYLEEAIKNIREDRAITSKLLTELMVDMQKSAADYDVHKQMGLIASKYVETLQRSNEQLVKITSILNKRQHGGIELDASDREELFDLIQGDKVENG